MSSTPPVKKRKSLVWRICYFLLCCIGAACLWYVWPVALVKPQFTISKETTYFTAPVDEEGYINYQVALNEKVSQGVTADNNAMVLLVKAIGPHPAGPGDLSDEFYQRLGIARPPSEGKYLIPLNALGKERQWPELANPDEADELLKQWSEQAVRPWSKDKLPRMAEWLERNREPLLLVDEATKRARYYAPLVYGTNTKPNQVSLMMVLLPYLKSMRELSNLYVARAMHAIHAKSYEAAWGDLLSALRLSRLLAQGPTVIEYLFANEIQLKASEAANSLLDRQLSLPLLERIQQELQLLPSMPNMAVQLDVGERNMNLDTVLMINRHGLVYLNQIGGMSRDFPKSSNHSLNRVRKANWDPILKQLNQWHDKLVSIAKITNRKQRIQEVQLVNDELQRLRQQLGEAEQGWGIYFWSGQTEIEHHGQKSMILFTTSLTKVFSAYDKSALQFRLMQLAVHLARHRQLHGKYPEKLSDMSPSPPQELTINLMNEQPFDYRRTDMGYQLGGPAIINVEGEGEIALDHYELLFAIPRPPRAPRTLEEIRGYSDSILFAVFSAQAAAVAGEQSSPLLILSLAAAEHLASSDPLGRYVP